MENQKMATIIGRDTVAATLAVPLRGVARLVAVTA